MQFIMSFIWALLISGAISYVLASMAGDPFNLTHTIVLAIILTLAVYVLGGGLLKEDSEH
ncbi:DUF2929 family protein [Virgibacillus alimentarius]|uniref:Membrane protein n=1 Tax=Virgibacillus alimentarius TaxID=698769 RepID=A0ABS4S9Q7_9BACI|nr:MULTISPECIES: DUF2929 family protein [Virgibacillus]MBP2258250.1 putative membrane protein [Virgibacillus alimentarius]HLR65811.1 DUF2929 family protein [Virgibacillus sp.]